MRRGELPHERCLAPHPRLSFRDGICRTSPPSSRAPMPATATPPRTSAFVPATTIDEVIARLDAVIDRARRENDRGGYFACLYRSVTVRVRDGIRANRFQDGARMERLDVIFANRYLEAEEAHRAGRPLTRSWLAAFVAAKRANLIILQHLLLGMNAHINLDLGIAAALAAPGKGITTLKPDFFEITRLLGEMLDEVQDRIGRVSPWMRIVDWIGRRDDERVFGFALGGTRELAWRSAARLAALPPERHGEEIGRMDHAVALLARPIHTPGLLLSPALRLVRMREPSEVGRVLDALR